MSIAPLRLTALLLLWGCDRPQASSTPSAELASAPPAAAAPITAVAPLANDADSSIIAPDSISADVLAACESFSVAASRLLRDPSARIVVDTVFHEQWTRTTRRGCSAIVTGHRAGGTEHLMDTHPTAGWTTMQRFFADGPDGASFGLWRPGVLCSFQVNYAGASDPAAPDGPALELFEVSCARDRPQDERDAAPVFPPDP